MGHASKSLGRKVGQILAPAGEVRRDGGRKKQTVLAQAPGNGAAIGGLRVAAESGWFAARPSGAENIYKIYAESFQGGASAPHFRGSTDDR